MATEDWLKPLAIKNKLAMQILGIGDLEYWKLVREGRIRNGGLGAKQPRRLCVGRALPFRATRSAHRGKDENEKGKPRGLRSQATDRTQGWEGDNFARERPDRECSR